MRIIKNPDVLAMTADETLCETITDWIRQRPSLNQVQCSVLDGHVIVYGTVCSARDRILALELALDAGADEVQDELHIQWPTAA